MKWELVGQHLYLVGVSSVLVIVLGLLLGIIAYLNRRTTKAIFFIVDILQTIPTLAMLGLIMVFFGASSTTVIVGLILYSLLPVVRNTHAGLSQINPAIKESARGMGMSQWQRLIHVELPLAFPMIFTGIRIAVVTSIGIAVFGTFVGGGGLGSILYRGVRTQNIKLMVQGTLALMVMSIVLDYVLAKLEKMQYGRYRQ